MFCKEMEKAQEHLKKLGHEAFTPDYLITEEEYQAKHGREKLLEMKPTWTKNHFKKIEGSDAILIINHEKRGVKGYFGSNTLIELSIAFYLGKKIFLLNKIGENHPHYEELIGIKPIILDGDLDKIK